MRCKSLVSLFVVVAGFSTEVAARPQAVRARTPTETLTVTPTPGPAVTVAVEELLAQVNNAIAQAKRHVDEANKAAVGRKEEGGQQPRLGSVKLTLHAGVTRESGTKVSFFIFQFGTTKTEVATRKITLTLSRPEQAKVQRTAMPTGRLADDLADAIIGAWLAAQAGQDAVKGLVPTETSCEISFGVTSDDKKGLNIVLNPFSIEAGKGSSVQTVQTIEITFAPKPGAKASST